MENPRKKHKKAYRPIMNALISMGHMLMFHEFNCDFFSSKVSFDSYAL